MANKLVQLILGLSSLLLCLPLIRSANTTQSQCDFQKYSATGCPADGHQVCHNATKTCGCDPSAAHPIPLADRCLAVRHIDQQCVVSTQCTKTTKNQLFCYYFDASDQQFVELNETLAISLQMNNKTVEGFCRCDDNHYYDYDDNQCVHKSNQKDVQSFIDQFFCSQCPIIDENSVCDRKSGRCVCKEGFIKGATGKCLRKRHLYERCGPSDECISTNTYCEPMAGSCICEDGFYVDPERQLCLKGRQLREKCAQHKECTYLYGHCDPNRNECLCDPKDSIRISDNCIKKTGYGQACHPKLPDLVCQMTLPYTICSRYTNRCVCDYGYIYLSNECKKVDINRLGISDDFRSIDDTKNPMTYIVIIFCTVFGFTIFASILIKMFRRPVPRRPIALYDVRDRRQTSVSFEARPPSAPPVYSCARDSTLTAGSHITLSDSDDKPPSYEEAISGSYCLTQSASTHA